jgi:hypothetical protein
VEEIPVLPSRAKERTVTVDGREHQVRYLKPAGLVPLSFPEHATGRVRVIEVDGLTNVGWLLANGKAYGDPSLPSDYTFHEMGTDRSISYEAFTREGAVERIIRMRGPEFTASCPCGAYDEDRDREALTERWVTHIDSRTGRTCVRGCEFNA